MRRISINGKDVINQTIASLLNGEVICYPTDTIYGIGTDANNESGIEKINTLKRRSGPMTIIINSFNHIADKISLNESLKEEADEILSKGDTCIMSYTTQFVSESITENKKIGLRIPQHAFLHALLLEYQKPITSTSVNRTDQSPLNNPNSIQEEFGQEIDLLIDAGEIKNKKASKMGSEIVKHPCKIGNHKNGGQK